METAIKKLSNMETVDDLITKISKASDRYGDKLLQFVDRYDLMGLCEATVEQLQEFIIMEEIGQ